MTASDDMETHTSSFAFIFLCFFDFRLSTFTHCASAGSPSGGISSESKVFSFFEGADEDEEGRFMAVAFWELLIGSHVPTNHSPWVKKNYLVKCGPNLMISPPRINRKSHFLQYLGPRYSFT